MLRVILPRCTGGTASTGTDFTLTAGTLGFAAGETSKTIPVTIVDDSLVCRDADTLHFIDVRSGAALATVPAPPNTGGVAYNGDAAFVVEYVPATDSVVFHKITRDGPLWSRPVDNLPTASPLPGR